jgi:peroxiredoxin
VPTLVRLFDAHHKVVEPASSMSFEDSFKALGRFDARSLRSNLSKRLPNPPGIRTIPSETEIEIEGLGQFARSSWPADFGPRPPLASLGPTSFEPWQHAGLDLSRASGERFVLAAKPQKPTLVVFYLGFGCLQCVEQLHALQKHQKALAAAGLDIVAIGDDPTDKLAAAIAALPADAPLTFPLLADPEHTAFRAWRCYDEFESLALHGTFLVDTDGSVRWQDLGAQPFAQFDWLLREAERLLALPRVAH